jgi:hypothetical protein
MAEGYQENWKDHLEIAESDRPPQLAFRYQPKKDETQNNQNDDSETKAILGFIGTVLKDLTL